ncbi:hypothetical protein Tco_0470507, partial [Tanacetum coccineum]
MLPMFSLVWIMSPRVMTRSAGHPATTSQGGGTDGRAGRGSCRTRGSFGDQGDSKIDAVAEFTSHYYSSS